VILHYDGFTWAIYKSYEWLYFSTMDIIDSGYGWAGCGFSEIGLGIYFSLLRFTEQKWSLALPPMESLSVSDLKIVGIDNVWLVGEAPGKNVILHYH